MQKICTLLQKNLHNSFFLHYFALRNLKHTSIMETKRFLKFYQNNSTFELTNPNPHWKDKKGFVWDRSDCVIRALAISIDCTWLEAYDFLSAKAREDFNVPNDSCGFRKWVTGNGAVWHYCKAEKGKSRMTAKEFAETHKEGRYVLSLAGHEAACVNGKILDAWNCGEKCVVGYYEMENFRLF